MYLTDSFYITASDSRNLLTYHPNIMLDADNRQKTPVLIYVLGGNEVYLKAQIERVKDDITSLLGEIEYTSMKDTFVFKHPSDKYGLSNQVTFIAYSDEALTDELSRMTVSVIRDRPTPFPRSEKEWVSTLIFNNGHMIMLDSVVYMWNNPVPGNSELTPRDDISKNPLTTSWIAYPYSVLLAAQVLLADFALLGQAVFQGKYLISQQGLNQQGEPSSNYGRFDEEKFENRTSPFMPNYAVNFVTGDVWSNGGNQRGFSNVPVISQNDISPENVAYATINVLVDCSREVLLPNDRKFIGVEFVIVNTIQVDGIDYTSVGQRAIDESQVISIRRKTDDPIIGSIQPYKGSYIYYKGYLAWRCWMFQKGSFLRLLCTTNESGEIIYMVTGHSDNFVMFDTDYCGGGFCTIYGAILTDRPYKENLPRVQFTSLQELYSKISNFEYGNNFENLK